MTEGILGTNVRSQLPGRHAFHMARAAAGALRRTRNEAWRRARFYESARAAARPFQWLSLRVSESLEPTVLTLRRTFLGVLEAASAVHTGFGRTVTGVRTAGPQAGARRALPGFRARGGVKTQNSARRLHAALLLALMFTLIFATSFFTVGLEVILDGESLGFVESQQEFEAAVMSVSARATEILQYPYTLKPNAAYRFSLVSRRNIFNRSQVESLLFTKVDGIRDLYVLSVAGVPVGASRSHSALKAILDERLARYDGQGHATFLQDVQIEKSLVVASMEKDIADLALILDSNLVDAQTYTVGIGDTAASVAEQHGLSVEDLLARNPEILSDEDGVLAEGQNLLLRKRVPFLSIQTVQRVAYTEPVAFDEVFEDNDTLFAGDNKIAVEGVPGEEQVTADVVSVDGEEIRRYEVGRVTLVAPVTQVTHVGTRRRVATGTYIRPFWGTITSNYGGRRLGGRYEIHTGVDFAGASGSAIVASDGGTVSFAGNNGNGYGNYVIINHGKGIQTVYAHCSKLLVKSGQKVAQGEAIARVGSTGRSTGPHVHFEVRVNGSHVNPWNYISR